MTVRMRRIHPGTYVGKGKAEEIHDRALASKADVVIFDHDLSPAQIRSLEKVTGAKVIDRSELILDIFASRAKTRQAKAQVELAQLEYTLPRLTGMWRHLSRIEGGIGTRGPGEKQLETDRRVASKRVRDLKREIKAIMKRSERQVRHRREEFTVSLVGYTNAGKTSLLNVLTGAHAFVEDKLFATLDTRTRVWQVDQGARVLLSDTVGFVRDLPHHLIASFHATLEEVTRADLLLHVVDISHPDCAAQLEAAHQVIEEIGCRGKSTLMIFNKVDALSSPAELSLLRSQYPEHVVTSALAGTGLDQVGAAVRRKFRERQVVVSLEVDASNGRLLAFLYNRGRVVDQQETDGRVQISALLETPYLGGLKRLSEGEPIEVKPGHEALETEA